MKPTLIELRQDRPGFSHFIGSWVCRAAHTILVDVGPSHSIGQLTASLGKMNIDHVDYVLLTHIHIDHAGGLAGFLDHFPMARIICHEKGIGHLVEPDRLEAASRKVLGDLVDTYGPICPVKRECFVSHRENEVPGLRIIETPGHAAHHLSFSYEGHLFAGEAGGIYLRVDGLDYTRPATPPVFFLRQFTQSIDRLLTLEDQVLCYPHFGKCQSSHAFLARAREQLLHWERIIRQVKTESTSSLVEASLRRLLETDPLLKAYGLMSEADQSRERLFMRHCIEGYLGYLSGRD